MKRIILSSVVGMLLLGFSPEGSAQIQADQLLSYFSSSCPTTGDWTKSAIGQAQALASVFESIQRDPNCQSISGALAQIRILEQQIARLSGDFTKKDLVSYQRQEQELLLQLSSPTYENMRDLVLGELQRIQIQIASLKGIEYYERRNQRTREAESLSSIVLSTDTLLAQALANIACIQHNPSLLSGLASFAGSVAAATTGSAQTLGLSAGVKLFGSLVKYAREKNLAAKVRNVNFGVEASAYQCALEALPDFWCTADDALRLVDFKRQMLEDKGRQPAWTGSKLFERDLPIFIAWLNRVRSGSEPTNTAEAVRRAQLYNRESEIKSGRDMGHAIITEKMPLFNTQSTPQQKFLILKETVKSLMGALGIGGYNPQKSGIFEEVIEAAYAPYFLAGIDRELGYVIPINEITDSIKPFENFNPYEQDRVGFEKFVPDLKVVRAQLTKLLVDALGQLNRQQIEILQTDPAKIVNDAVIEDTRTRSPFRALDQILSFLNVHSPASLSNGSLHALYNDSTTRLKEVREQIVAFGRMNGKSTPEQREVAAKEVIKVITEQMRLEFGTVFIQDRLETVVRLALTDLVRKPNGLLDPAMVAQLMAADDVLREIGQFNLNTDLTKIKTDLDNAQLVTQNNIQNFVDLFGKNISRVLRVYRDGARATNDYTRKQYEQASAQICTKLLSAPSWPKDVPFELCSGKQMQSFFTDGPKSEALSSNVLQEPLNKRACEYRNYFRANKIHQHSLEPDSHIPRFDRKHPNRG